MTSKVLQELENLLVEIIYCVDMDCSEAFTGGVLWKRLSLKYLHCSQKTICVGSLFNKVAGLRTPVLKNICERLFLDCLQVLRILSQGFWSYKGENVSESLVTMNDQKVENVMRSS